MTQIKPFFPKLIELESTEDTPITKLFLSINEKTFSFMIEPKFVKKLTNNTLLVEVTKKTYLDLLLEQKSLYNLEIKSYHHNSLN